jgi:rRNA maturation endonuclease Nob1
MALESCMGCGLVYDSARHVGTCDKCGGEIRSIEE